MHAVQATLDVDRRLGTIVIAVSDAGRGVTPAVVVVVSEGGGHDGVAVDAAAAVGSVQEGAQGVVVGRDRLRCGGVDTDVLTTVTAEHADQGAGIKQP